MWVLKHYLSKCAPEILFYSVINNHKNMLSQLRSLTTISDNVSKTIHKNITSSLLTKYLHNRNHFVKIDQENINCNTFTYRTHNCGELRPEHEGLKVVLCGWVQFSRLSKFLLLRDAYGLTQCVLGIDNGTINFSNIPLETIVKVEGIVTLRPKDMINNDMYTENIKNPKNN